MLVSNPPHKGKQGTRVFLAKAPESIRGGKLLALYEY
jgi:hypothetical protein